MDCRPCYMMCCYIKMDKTSWTYGKNLNFKIFFKIEASRWICLSAIHSLTQSVYSREPLSIQNFNIIFIFKRTNLFSFSVTSYFSFFSLLLLHFFFVLYPSLSFSLYVFFSPKIASLQYTVFFLYIFTYTISLKGLSIKLFVFI